LPCAEQRVLTMGNWCCGPTGEEHGENMAYEGLRKAFRTEAVKAYVFHLNVLKIAFHALEDENVAKGGEFELVQPAVHKFVTDCPRKKTKSKELGNALFMLMTGNINMHYIDRSKGKPISGGAECAIVRKNDLSSGDSSADMEANLEALWNQIADAQTDVRRWAVFHQEWDKFEGVRLDSKTKLVRKIEEMWFFLCNDVQDSDVNNTAEEASAVIQEALKNKKISGSFLDEPLVGRASLFKTFEQQHLPYRLFDSQQLSCMLADLEDEEEVEFLRSLCVSINDEDWMGHRKFMNTPNVDVMHGTFSHRGDEKPTYEEEKDSILDAHPLAQLTKESGEHTCMAHYSCAGQLFFEREKTFLKPKGFVDGWICQLLWPEAKGSRRELTNVMWFLDYLSRSDTPSGVFATPIVQGVVRFHWQQVYWTFIRDRLVDVATLILMWRLVHAVHFQKRPDYWIFWGLFGAASYAMSKVLINICMSIYIFGKSGVYQMASAWNVVATFFDIYGFAITFTAVIENEIFYSTETEFSNTFCGKHEVLVFLLIATKWLYCLLQIMNLEKIGHNILPVWEAVKCEESYTFLGYLSLATAGMTMSYYAYASDEESLTTAFIRTFRLFWLADMDIYELDGVDGTMDLSAKAVNTMYNRLTNGTWANQNFTDDQFEIGTSGDGDLNKNDKNGMRFFMVMSVFLGTVMFMNVYIALLGNKYDDVKAEINERFTQFRLQCVKSMMLRCHMFMMIRTALGKRPSDEAYLVDKNRLFLRLPEGACSALDVDPENAGLATKQDAVDIKQMLITLQAKLVKMEESEKVE